MFRIFIGISLFLIGCNTRDFTKQNTQENSTGGYNYFGQTFNIQGTSSITELLASLERRDTVSAKLRATVEAVCQMKGCWMNLVEKGSGDQSILVKFKDYAFFVPMDIAGEEVVVLGKAYQEITPVEELRHYAEDAGKNEEEIASITSPKKEIKFLASGVAIPE